jgi:hypothetical protein
MAWRDLSKRARWIVIFVGLVVEVVLIVFTYHATWSVKLGTWEWLASAAKYIGLAVAMGLGVAGTVTDTKEKTETGYKVKDVGWFVITAIIVSSLIGAAGQYYEDKAKKIKEDAATDARKRQLDQLAQITLTAERTLTKFSGHANLSVSWKVPFEQPGLDNVRRYQAFRKRMKQEIDGHTWSSYLNTFEPFIKPTIDRLQIIVRVEGSSAPGKTSEGTRFLQLEMRKAVCSVSMFQPDEWFGDSAEVSCIGEAQIGAGQNRGFNSVKDFENTRVHLWFVDDKGPIPKFVATASALAFLDRDTGAFIADARLREVTTKVADQVVPYGSAGEIDTHGHTKY